MSEINAVTVATNRYGVGDSANINLFTYNGVEDMTLNQLIMTMCIRRSASLERMTVVHMNEIANGTSDISELTDIAERILANDDKAWKDADKKRVAELCGVNESDLPSSISSVNDALTAWETVEETMTSLNSSVDRTAIELQTDISRRDTMYNYCTTMTTHMGKSGLNTASAYK